MEPSLPGGQPFIYVLPQAKIGFESNQGVYLDRIQRQAIFNVFNLSIMLYN